MIEMLAQIVVGLVLAATQPDRLACPRGWHIEDFDQSGGFRCRPNPVPCNESRDPDCEPRQPPGEIWLRVFCRSNAIPTYVTPANGLFIAKCLSQ